MAIFTKTNRDTFVNKNPELIASFTHDRFCMMSEEVLRRKIQNSCVLLTSDLGFWFRT